AEPGAFRKTSAKWLKDRVELFGGNAHTFVRDFQHDTVGTAADAALDPRTKTEMAAGLHGPQAVGREVPDDLPHLILVGFEWHFGSRHLHVDDVAVVHFGAVAQQ